MKRTKPVIIVFVVILALSLGILDLLSDKKERYIIKNVSVQLLTPRELKSDDFFCSELSRNIRDNDSIILIGVDYELEYVSVTREHFWDFLSFPDGWEGKADFIDSITFTYNNTNINKNLSLAEGYNSFYSYDRMKYVGNQMTGNCYTAETPRSINEFIETYNCSNQYTVRRMENLHVFRLRVNEIANWNRRGDMQASFFLNGEKKLTAKIIAL